MVFEFYEDAAGEHRWRPVSARNGRTVADSAEGYATYSGARRAARAVVLAMRSPAILSYRRVATG